MTLRRVDIINGKTGKRKVGMYARFITTPFQAASIFKVPLPSHYEEINSSFYIWMPSKTKLSCSKVRRPPGCQLIYRSQLDNFVCRMIILSKCEYCLFAVLFIQILRFHSIPETYRHLTKWKPETRQKKNWSSLYE